MRARVFPDYDAMSAAAADVVAQRLEERPSAVFVLPTGITPLGMYRRLLEMHSSQGLSFAEATFFNLDEYLGLAPDHAASYHVYMKENFYGLVDADPARVFVPDGTAPDPEAECDRYEAAIAEAGGIDVCVLGIGRNGHIGFNEPGAPFDSRTRVVHLFESTRKVNAGDFEADRAPERAITVGMATIFESREVLLLASGTNKAGAIAAAVEGEASESVPASMLKRHPNARLFLDKDAASALGGGVTE
ncbi:MAG: glucosamine-6-phosphate deaminase [Actinomycetota bacterium]|nr:glucosamine-6-phosphate deaminase [Actinomycetota bacterium]